MSRYIELTRGKRAVVDDEDYERVVAAGKWFAHPSHATNYARRNIVRPDGTRSVVALHTFLTGWPLVDHRNGDGLDNRRENLRPATDRQNRANRRLNANSTSGYKGVTWHPSTQRWRARIVVDGRKVSLGLYRTAEAAARAYDAAAVAQHGEFAGLNFPTEVAA